MKPRLLLHACCGPCATWPLPRLMDEWEVEGLFFNPNISPKEEYYRRLEGARRVFKEFGVRVDQAQYSGAEIWNEFADDAAARHAACYKTRLYEAAERARDGGFDAFCTTLLISPWQDHELIRITGEKAGKDYGVYFYYEDFRPRFREGQATARSMGIYMQKYCGCAPSIAEAAKSASERRAKATHTKEKRAIEKGR